MNKYFIISNIETLEVVVVESVITPKNSVLVTETNATFIKPIANGLGSEFTMVVESYSDFEKLTVLKNRLISRYIFLMQRAKASAMQKELNPEYQQTLELEYKLKHEISSGQKTNEYSESLLKDEALNDFDIELTFPIYKGMVNAMYTSGEQVFDNFISMVGRGRCAGLTAYQRGQVVKLEAIVVLMESVPEELTMQEVKDLTTNLLTLTQR